ncbi:MAG: altronate dehydratase family protein [Bacteroidetes bacterium]|nr:altronate dehydratase family protein [Bacteroidota bacterium]
MGIIKVIKIHPKDNVLVALTNLVKGESIQYQNDTYILKEDIEEKHKFFIKDIEVGSFVTMYGITVGKIVVDKVEIGQRMTTQNTKHEADPYSYRGKKITWQAPNVSKFANKTFNGYHRSDGKVGTANYWLFIPTVFCENRNLDVIKESLHHALGYTITDKYREFTDQLISSYQQTGHMGIDEQTAFAPITHKRIFKNIDGIKFLNHSGGCGGTRQDASTLSNLLAAYADHPNVAGVTLLSLGCQHLQIQDFKDDLQKRNPQFRKPLIIFEQQQSQSEEQLIKSAIQQTLTHLVEANKIERTPAPLSKLCIGVKCGGSDGFSGISANPAVGYTADILVALGGQILLAEFPELCGAEQELLDRCVDEKTANKFITLMEDYNKMAHAVGSGFHMNPSPGNIKDGLITDAIKSAGACKKGGTAPVEDVLDYTEPAIKSGLHLVCTPGNDVEATTGKAASGATLILFTTGLGTPTGNPVCPVIKVSTNTKLANRMSDIIDINTGDIIDGLKTIEQMGEEILEYCIKAASGEIIPKAVLLHQDDFIPWKRGVSL